MFVGFVGAGLGIVDGAREQGLCACSLETLKAIDTRHDGQAATWIKSSGVVVARESKTMMCVRVLGYLMGIPVWKCESGDIAASTFQPDRSSQSARSYGVQDSQKRWGVMSSKRFKGSSHSRNQSKLQTPHGRHDALRTFEVAITDQLLNFAHNLLEDSPCEGDFCSVALGFEASILFSCFDIASTPTNKE